MKTKGLAENGNIFVENTRILIQGEKSQIENEKLFIEHDFAAPKASENSFLESTAKLRQKYALFKVRR